jgi:hypothetical protein
MAKHSLQKKSWRKKEFSPHHLHQRFWYEEMHSSCLLCHPYQGFLYSIQIPCLSYIERGKEGALLKEGTGISPQGDTWAGTEWLQGTSTAKPWWRRRRYKVPQNERKGPGDGKVPNSHLGSHVAQWAHVGHEQFGIFLSAEVIGPSFWWGNHKSKSDLPRRTSLASPLTDIFVL